MKIPVPEKSEALPGPAPIDATVSRSGASTFSALKHRNFQLYFGGQLVSNIGTWMQTVAQGWVVYQIGRSEITLGLVAFASAIPVLIASPWAGVLVDRMSRQKLLMLTQAGAMIPAFSLAALTFADVLQEWHVIALAALLGLVNAFDAPARQTFVSEMVAREDLPNAIALNSMVTNSARVIGPALAGLALAAVGAAWCFTVNGLSFLAVILGLGLMKLPPPRKTQRAVSPREQLKSGLKYTAKRRELAGLILLALVFSVFGVSYAPMLPAFVQTVLKQDALAYGLVNAAIGIGAVLGAVLLARNVGHGRRGKLLAGVNVAFPLMLVAFAYVGYPLTLVVAFGLGLGYMLQFTTINTLLQTRVEDEYRGRVMALYTLAFFGFSPLGNLSIGYLAQHLGLRVSIALFAVLSLILSRLALWKTPEVKTLR
ncbi:MAG: MFS transporter [Anaerolineaceae bacterium]|nr:MFS transporter [Anaerolineae bacterium]MCE7906538.1 MFS transporter [Anaerolineae bacterium CFX3]MDL1925125.1 MFS transporter [Anaerolineae bacterium AMX1]WKZ54408.1 MAG: MFS transporter [Anaerolineales bacterium]GIK09750.1 MAG: MFS transporter [Chloroflexota bacterium]GJQ38736.1 MAG: MFS transporter [Anaerolineaceae bacterium]